MKHCPNCGANLEMEQVDNYGLEFVAKCSKCNTCWLSSTNWEGYKTNWTKIDETTFTRMSGKTQIEKLQEAFSKEQAVAISTESGHNHKINLNSPAGNVFNLMGIMSKLITEAGLPTEHLDEFNKRCFELHTYDEIVNACKEELKLINKISVDQYEIIETENYQLF